MSHVSILFYRECQDINKIVKVIESDIMYVYCLGIKDLHYFLITDKIIYVIPWTLIIWPW